MASYESMSGELIEERLSLLAGALLVQGSPRYELVVCGGSALAVLGLHARTTRDVDVLALMNPDTRRLERPDPIPMPLAVAAATVARRASLPANWLNNGPSSGEGGLFQMGLPEGIEERLTTREYGERLAVHFVSRFDQIHFKLYAAIDQQGSYHTADLLHLNPTAEEIQVALKWVFSHDPSPGFRQLAAVFLRKVGFADVTEGL